MTKIVHAVGHFWRDIA